MYAARGRPRAWCDRCRAACPRGVNSRPIRTATMILATSYPFLEVFWTMLIFFAFVVWIWILFTVLADIFRRHDTSGFAKVLWIIFIIMIPYFGVFIYLIAEHKGMTERAIWHGRKPPKHRSTSTCSPSPARRSRRADRQGQAAARQRHDHAGRVRPDQAEGAGNGLASAARPPCLARERGALPGAGGVTGAGRAGPSVSRSRRRRFGRRTRPPRDPARSPAHRRTSTRARSCASWRARAAGRARPA